MLDKVGAFSPARGNRLSWLISENILGERHSFELELMVEMDAMLSRRAEHHNMRTLYWSQGGVRPLTIIFINGDLLRLVSSEYGRRITKGVFTLKIHSCGGCVLYLFC